MEIKLYGYLLTWEIAAFSLNCGGTELEGSYQFYHSLSGIRQFIQVAILECTEMQANFLQIYVWCFSSKHYK